MHDSHTESALSRTANPASRVADLDGRSIPTILNLHSTEMTLESYPLLSGRIQLCHHRAGDGALPFESTPDRRGHLF